MRTSFTIFLFLACPLVALAQQPVVNPSPSHPDVTDSDPRQDQVQAATVNAMATLRDQVLRTQLTRNLQVKDFLDLTSSTGELDRVLKGAQPVGGPRWVDDQTCQVRLELPESRVGALLMGIAHTPNQHAPIRPDVLKAKFSDWGRLDFSAVGSSAGGGAIELARPGDAGGKWSEIGDRVRESTIANARADAVKQLVALVGTVRLDAKSLASAALARPLISQKFNAWLAKQPVTRIEFLDDLKVSVTLSAVPKAMARAFKTAVISDPDFYREQAIDWDQVGNQIESLGASIDGFASATAVPASTLPAVVLPPQPPEWIDRQLQAQASVERVKGTSGLKRGRSAEADAENQIRDQFLLLHIDSKTTLGDAARSDGELKAAIDRAMLQTRTDRVEYLDDGSVKVHVSLDLRQAWESLRSSR